MLLLSTHWIPHTTTGSCRTSICRMRLAGGTVLVVRQTLIVLEAILVTHEGLLHHSNHELSHTWLNGPKARLAHAICFGLKPTHVWYSSTVSRKSCLLSIPLYTVAHPLKVCGGRTVSAVRCSDRIHVRCSFFDGILHSRMPLDSTPIRLKRTCVRPVAFLSGVHCSYLAIINHAETLKVREVQIRGCQHGVVDGYGARFPTQIYTRGCHWIPRMFA
jgi:hypothetical protein